MTPSGRGSYVGVIVTRRRAFSLISVVCLVIYGGLLFYLRIGSGDVRDYGLASADGFLYFYPSYEQMYARVGGGVLPRWNPWQLFGAPWLAASQPGLYYPGHLAYLALPTHTAMAVSGVAHLLLAAVGVYAFLRRTGLGNLAGLTGAILFAFRGHFLTCLSGPSLEEAAAWIGIGAFGVVALVERRTVASIALLAIAAALSLLAGYPQHTVYLFYVWATLAAARLAAARLGLRPWLWSGALFAGALVLAFLIAAAQILPTVELIRASTRTMASLPDHVLSPLGNPAGDTLIRLPITGSPHSFGVTTLVLVGVAAIGGRHLSLLLWALVVGLASAVFALGTATPWFWIYRAMPGIGMFRGPERILVLTDFAIAVVAAIAVDALAYGPDVARRSWQRLVIAVPWAVVAAWWILFHLRLGTPGAGLVAAGFAIACVVWVLASGTRLAGGIAAAMLALVATEIFARTDLAMVLPYTIEKVKWFESVDPTFRYLALQAPHERIWLWSTLDPPFAAKQATRHRLRSIEDDEPMNLTRQNRYLTFFGQGEVTDSVNDLLFMGYVPGALVPPPNGSSSGTRRRLLDLGAVGRIVMPVAKAGQPRTVQFLTAAGLGAAEVQGPVAVVKNPNAAPRAFIVYRTTPVPAEPELLRRLADPSFDPLALAYVEGDPGFAPAVDAPERGAAARFIADGEDVVEVEAKAEAAGLLVLADTYAGGWYATVDGMPAPILPTNYLFRGVPVPAGTHRVRFVYRPWTIPAGQAISLASVLALALLCRRRAAAPATS